MTAFAIERVSCVHVLHRVRVCVCVFRIAMFRNNPRTSEMFRVALGMFLEDVGTTQTHDNDLGSILDHTWIYVLGN